MSAVGVLVAALTSTTRTFAQREESPTPRETRVRD